MIDLALLRSDPDRFRRMCQARKASVDIDHLIKLDFDYRDLKGQVESLRARQRKLGRDSPREEAAQLKAELRHVTERANALEAERDRVWHSVPNLFADDTPLGAGDEDNTEILREGECVPFDAERGHETVGERLGFFDLKRGAAVSGTGFYYWRAGGARLAWATFSLALELLSLRGFTPMITPLLARERTFFGTGYLPFFSGELYRLEGTDLALIGTSEQTLVDIMEIR